MPDALSAAIAIGVMTLATYATRLAGYLLGSRIGRDSTAARVLDVLPGAALAGVLALSLASLGPADYAAVGLAVVVYLASGRTLPAILAGLAVAVGAAHGLPAP